LFDTVVFGFSFFAMGSFGLMNQESK